MQQVPPHTVSFMEDPPGYTAGSAGLYNTWTERVISTCHATLFAKGIFSLSLGFPSTPSFATWLGPRAGRMRRANVVLQTAREENAYCLHLPQETLIPALKVAAHVRSVQFFHELEPMEPVR